MNQNTPFRSYMATLREKSGKSLTDIAEAAGVSRSSVWRLEQGKYSSVYGGTLAAILHYGYGLEPESRAYKKAISLWTEEKTGSRVVHTHGTEWTTLAARIGRLKREQVALLERLISNPPLLKAVAGFLEAVPTR